jgi:hypothetical protein
MLCCSRGSKRWHVATLCSIVPNSSAPPSAFSLQSAGHHRTWCESKALLFDRQHLHQQQRQLADLCSA